MLLDTINRTMLARHIPFTGVSFSDSLMDGGGTFQGSYPIDRPEFSAWPSGDFLRRVIVPHRDGVPQGFYLFTEMPPAPADTVVQPIRATRLDWLFSHRAITKDLIFTTKDQNHIVRDLLRFGMGQWTMYSTPTALNNSAILAKAQIPWITLDTTLSGVTRTRADVTGNTDDGYPGNSRKIVAQMVKNLCDLRDESGTRGPEYRWLYRSAADGLPEMVLDMSGPSGRVGKPEDDPRGLISFEFPGGRKGAVESASYGSDGTSIVTRAHVIGQKQDNTAMVGLANYDDLLALGFPLIDVVSSESSVQSQSVLNGKAAGKLWAADDAWALTLNGSGNPAWGSYAIGDWIVLRVIQGLTPKNRSMRITGWTIKPSDDGSSETVTPTVQVGKWYT
jgi:hypothetical protein